MAAASMNHAGHLFFSAFPVVFIYGPKGLDFVLSCLRREEHVLVLLEPWKPLNHNLTHLQLSPTKATGESFHCLQVLFHSASRRPQCSLCRRQVLSGIDVDSVDCRCDCSVDE